MFNDANFREAQFHADDADFGKTQFHGVTYFCWAQFRDGAHFDETQFHGGITDFREAQFQGATFRRTQFRENVDFRATQFHKSVNFTDTQFHQRCSFNNAQFHGNIGPVTFAGTQFYDRADFNGAQFFSHDQELRTANFTGTEFRKTADFSKTRFRGRADFTSAVFVEADRFGPLAADFVTLDCATFSNAVTVEAAATVVSCVQTRFEAGVTLRLRYATLSLEWATLAAASIVTGSDQPFDSLFRPDALDLDDGYLADLVRRDRQDGEARPRDSLRMASVASLRGVNVTELTISDIDLSRCRFTGAHHLDKLRIEGRSRFAEAPRWPARCWPFRFRWAWPPVWWWTRRQLLAEEVPWRAAKSKGADWYVPPERDGSSSQAVSPETLAALYRSLRKAQEDNKNEPGAADFYYGEMEMRRHAPATPFAERFVLFLYWLVSGYGLRATRALGLLITLIIVATFGFHHIGFVNTHPDLGTSALYVVESAVSLESKLAGTESLTWQGEVLRLVMRLGGPLLFGLALLAIRNRVKR